MRWLPLHSHLSLYASIAAPASSLSSNSDVEERTHRVTQTCIQGFAPTSGTSPLGACCLIYKTKPASSGYDSCEGTEKKAIIQNKVCMVQFSKIIVLTSK